MLRFPSYAWQALASPLKLRMTGQENHKLTQRRFCMKLAFFDGVDF
jgi:hypothetical protein